MSVPNHLLYTKDHEWIEFKDEYAIVGITDYAQSQLGDVIFVEFPAILDNFHVYFATWSKYFATWDFFWGSGALPSLRKA